MKQMMRWLRQIEHYIWPLFMVAVVLIGVQTFEIIYYGIKGFYLKMEAEVFSEVRESDKGRVLIVGDSTGVGVGADRKEESVAGKLYRDGFSVENRARSGALMKEIVGQLQESERENYDLILIMAGGNDILWFYNLEKSVVFLESSIELAKEKSDKVLILPPGNIGLAPIFYEPIGIIYKKRTEFVRDNFKKVAGEKEVIYVDLFTHRLEDLYSYNPEKLFADDLLHPSSLGYEVWYERIRGRLVFNLF